MTTTCPFCGGEAHILDWQSVCTKCFRRWETTYTEKLRDEYKGGLKNGKKSVQQKESS
jgi:hypothetical protein